ncbi:MAG: type II toxin-antitoxin system Phd/YefM family antitoxin [Acidobacteriota bacterium]
MNIRAVGIRELKNRLSEYLRYASQGDRILVTDRGRVIAELSSPNHTASSPQLLSAILALASQGSLRIGAANDKQLYPEISTAVAEGTVAQLLDEERGNR